MTVKKRAEDKKNAHQERAAKALRDNLRRRKLTKDRQTPPSDDQKPPEKQD